MFDAIVLMRLYLADQLVDDTAKVTPLVAPKKEHFLNILLLQKRGPDARLSIGASLLKHFVQVLNRKV